MKLVIEDSLADLKHVGSVNNYDRMFLFN